MSIKIYNGYRLPYMSLAELQRLCREVKTRMEPVQNDILAEWYAGHAAEWLDRKAMGRLTESQSKEMSAWYYASHKYREEMREARASRERSTADVSFEVCLIPMEDRTLAMTFSEQTKLEEIWAATPGVEDFHYQNQTDQPDNLTEEAWEARGEVWERAMPDYIPGNWGFSFHISAPMGKPSAGNVLKHFPSFEDRVRKEALDTMYPVWEELQGLKGSDFSLNKLHDYLDWFKENPPERVAREQEIRGMLKEHIEKDDLFP